MFRSQRLEEIMCIVSQQRYVTVAELVNRLFASPATIRRDISILEKDQLIVKSHGGITLAGGHQPLCGA